MKIEFLSYDGHFPNLCSGELILRIDGKIHSFYYRNALKDDRDPEFMHSAFWSSGGTAYIDDESIEHVDYGPWTFNVDRLPDFLKPHATEVFDVFSANVPEGCCGGCI